MGKEKESIIEQNLISDLQKLGYEYLINVKNEEQLKDNFREQFCKFNEKALCGKPFTDAEFTRFYNDNIKRSIAYPVFEAAKKIRQSIVFKRDDGSDIYLKWLSPKISENIYQVVNQIKVRSENRYDVTVLINGLPLIQFELKRCCVEVSKAQAQVEEYCKKSYNELFNFIQIFICSNGNSTIYGANLDYVIGKVVYSSWTDRGNNLASYAKLSDFVGTFLNKSFITKYINDYEVLIENERKMLALRPYQVYAIEDIIQMADAKQNGYIWHTTGSGKTITAWKAASLISKRVKDVKKTVLVVDSIELDAQLRQEYLKFETDADVTAYKTNTQKLIKALNDEVTRTIVVTVQTLYQALSIEKNRKKLELIRNQRMIMLVDESHRSWYGLQKNIIKKFFTNTNYFGFTGTPLFRGKNVREDDISTEEVFGKCLHTYTIKDAIRDKNVLGFNVEYLATQISNEELKKLTDKELGDIERDVIYHNEKRIRLISKSVIDSIERKTLNGVGSAIFSTDSVDAAMKYFHEIRKQKPDLKTAVIFSKSDDLGNKLSIKHKEDLEFAMKDYNKQFGTKFTVDEFEAYRMDIQMRLKMSYTKKLDLLIVVDMFLTGFDSKYISCIYIDKNLRWHKLLQAISRANRIMIDKQSANVVLFRDLKKEMDEAILLFSNDEGIDDIVARTYNDYVKYYIDAAKELREACETPMGALELHTEDEIGKFVEAYKKVVSSLKSLQTFEQFNWADIEKSLSEDEYHDYMGFYKELREEVRSGKRDVDPELLNFELVKDSTIIINLAYIINLLHSVKTINEIPDIIKAIEASDDDGVISVKDMLIKSVKSLEADADGKIQDADLKVIEKYNEEKHKKIQEFAIEKGIDVGIAEEIFAKAEYGKVIKKADVTPLLSDFRGVEKVQITKNLIQLVNQIAVKL